MSNYLNITEYDGIKQYFVNSENVTAQTYDDFRELEQKLEEANGLLKKAFIDGFEYGEVQGENRGHDCLILDAEQCFIGSDTQTGNLKEASGE